MGTPRRADSLPGRLRGLAAQRCPLCRNGRIFSAPMTMHAQCPACRYVFEREPGYFLGAIVIGYILGVVLVAALGVLTHVAWPALGWEWSFVAGVALYLPFTPAVFRYSRTIWMYVDNWLDPPGG